MEPSRSIDDDDIDSTCLASEECIVECGRGISALFGLNNLNATSLGPYVELFNRSSAKGICRTEQSATAFFAEERSQFARGGGLAGAVDAHHHDDLWRSRRMGRRLLHAVEDGAQLF